MLALSTSWKSKGIPNGEALIEALEPFDLNGIELEYRITDKIYHEMKAPLKHSGLDVISIHNFFPFPTHSSFYKGGGDLFRLSDPDKEERQRAILGTIKTIEHANDLESSVVILHCGYVDMKPELDQLRHYYDSGEIESDEAHAFLKHKRLDLDRRKSKYLDSLLFSLDKLVRIAEKQNVWLGLENRYHYHELPGPNDFEGLLAEFEGGPVGYWHDMGHAHALEVLTLISSNELLAHYSEKLIGIHLHDAQGLNDHLAPGTGEIDFESLKPYLKADTKLVIELKPDTPDADVTRGIRFLQEKGIGTIHPQKKEKNQHEKSKTRT